MTSTGGPTAVPRVAAAVWAGIGGAALLAIALVTLGWRVDGWPRDLVALGVLLCMGIAASLAREPDVGSRVSFSFLSIIVLACIVLVGPVGGALVGAVAAVFELGHRQHRVRLFNACMFANIGAVGGLVYLLVGGVRGLETLDGAGPLLIRVGLPLMVADVAQCLCNALLLAAIVRVDRGIPIRRFAAQMLRQSGIAYVGYGVIGFLFVILWIPAGVGPFSAVLILAPLFVARWAFVQFGEEQRAHERTLSALVAAVEVKDPYAAGHSGRIAQLAEWMAEPLGLTGQQAQSLRFAAMLHDVGKVAVPTRILRRHGGLSEADLAVLRLHPERGVEMVRGIDFLAASLDGILHHHERFDGLGYPAGLAGEDIPLQARVIAVADAFDSLTATRLHQGALSSDAAVWELQSRTGTQFDPAVVAALARALTRREWSPDEPGEEVLAARAGLFDHDDPSQADSPRLQAIADERSGW